MMTLDPPRKLAGPARIAEPEAWRVLGLSRAGLSRFLRTAQTAVGLNGEVDVLLTSDRELRRLNREFRGQDKATDVLSFPPADFMPSAVFMPSSFPGDGNGKILSHAGDLAISLETALAQAEEHGHSLRDEVRVLLLHGLLHLAGLDHETDRGEMAAREAALRQVLRLPNGLIARTVGAVTNPRLRSRTSRLSRAVPSRRGESAAVRPRSAAARREPADRAARPASQRTASSSHRGDA